MRICDRKYSLQFTKIHCIFTELEFSIEVYPVRISILELYDPGDVIRIWAWDKSTKYWQKLWSGPPQCCKRSKFDNNVRIFTPPLAVCQFKTYTIRLEFNHSLTRTRIEGVLLFGTEELIVPNDSMINAIPISINCGKDSEENNSKIKDSESKANSSMLYHENDTHNLTPYGPSEETFDEDRRNFKIIICNSHSIYARYTNNSKIFFSSTPVKI